MLFKGSPYGGESLSLNHWDPIELHFTRAYVVEYFTSINGSFSFLHL